MRTLFDLLKARPLNDSVNIESLEKKYGVMLPPTYKLFVQSFYLGEKQIHRELFYSTKYKDYFDCSAYIYTPNEDIGFSHFNEIEKCFEIWDSGGLSDMDYEKKFFPIGGGNYGTYVGLENEYKDKILMRSFSICETILSDNIFEFVRGVEVLELKESYMTNMGGTYSQLYKNWGENFWRMKEA